MRYAVAMQESPPIGIVLGNEDATPLNFWFTIKAGYKVQLDDIVHIIVQDPSVQDPSTLNNNVDDGDENASNVHFYGVVDEVRRRFEGVHFEGDTELVADGLMPANTSYSAHVIVTRVEPEDFIPPSPGDSVYFAEGAQLDKALYLDNMDIPLPAGVLRNGEAGYINFDFVNGTKGAHINISGISGIATKTSYALFLLYSIFNAQKRDKAEPLSNTQHSKALIFNVKGEDLLFLDKDNKRFEEQERKWQEKRHMAQNRFEICGLPARAFDSVELYAPAKGDSYASPNTGERSDGIRAYVWSLHEFALGRMLPFLLTDRDGMSNLGFLVSHIEEKLYKLAQNQKHGQGYLEIDSAAQQHFYVPPSQRGEEAGQGHFSSQEGLSFDDLDRRTGVPKLNTFDDVVDFLEYKLLYQGMDDDGKNGGDSQWTANQAKATREALIRRLRGASKHVRTLIRADLNSETLEQRQLDILGSAKQVHVIDIHSLAPLAQMFVVGVILKQVFEGKENRKGGQIFVVLDELNKYAPAQGDSPIKDVLLDIAERGRSLGIILIGAQQTASEVERRIVGNAAVRVVGRLDAAESERSEYRFMPATFRLRSTILAPGTMIVHQPDVPSPMMLNFPFPAWATRASEVADELDTPEKEQAYLEDLPF